MSSAERSQARRQSYMCSANTKKRLLRCELIHRLECRKQREEEEREEEVERKEEEEKKRCV